MSSPAQKKSRTDNYLTEIIPLKDCIALGENPYSVPNLPCTECSRNAADLYCEDERFLCYSCTPDDRLTKQVQIEKNYVRDALIEPEKLELGKNLQSLASRKSELVKQKKDKSEKILRATRDHIYRLIEQQHLHEVNGMEESYQRFLSTSDKLSNSQQLNYTKSLQKHVDAAMTSNFGIHSDDSYPTSSSENIIKFVLEELQSPTPQCSSLKSVTPVPSPEPAPSSPLVLAVNSEHSEPEPSNSVSRAPSPPQLGSLPPPQLAQRTDSFILKTYEKPEYICAFFSTSAQSYTLPNIVVPANTLIVCYTEHSTKKVFLKMDSDRMLAYYEFPEGEPMGLAEYRNFLFVVDRKSKCVYTINLSSDKKEHISYPSMDKERGIFHTPSGIVVVDQYLIVMDCAPSKKSDFQPQPWLHVFDLRRRDFPFVCTISLDGVVIMTNTNSCRLSVKNDEERSFYIFSDDTVVTCTLPVDLFDRPRSSAEQSSRSQMTKHLRADDWFSGFRKDHTSRHGSRVAQIPTPYSAAVHRSSDGRKLVYVSRSPIGETSRLPLYVWDADKGEIDHDKSKEISARLRTLLKGYDSPTHLCVCTVPSSSTSSFLSSSSSSPREGSDRDEQESAYLLMTLHTTRTIICLKIH